MAHKRTPHRVQRRRIKGWRMPANTVYVGRPTQWGNQFKPGSRLVCFGSYSPYIWTAIGREGAVQMHDVWLKGLRKHSPRQFERLIAPLRGKNLACWCPLDKPCHADNWLRYANKVNRRKG